MPCRICAEPKTVKSHLMPRAFALDARTDEPHLRVGTYSQTGFGIIQGGHFDREILCEKHEAALQRLDDYGVEFVREFPKRRKLCGRHRDQNLWGLRDIDSDLLVRFAASVIWRWSASNLPIANDVSLGGQEGRFREVVFDGVDCAREPMVGVYSLNSRRLGPEPVSRIIMTPSESRPDGIRCWGFGVGGLVFFVKADKRPAPVNSRPLGLNGRSVYVVEERWIEDGPEFVGITNILRNMRRPREAYRAS